MEAASFYGMKWNKRYSEQPDNAVTIVEAGICPNQKKSRSDFTQNGISIINQRVIMLASSLGFRYIVSKFARTALRLHRR